MESRFIYNIIAVALAVVSLSIISAPHVAAASLHRNAETQDTQPPQTPNNFRIDSRSANSMYLNWDWAADQGGGYVSQYELRYLDKRIVANHNYPGETISLDGFNLSPGNAYTIELWAIDNSGNRALAPARLVFETTPPGVANDLRLVGLRLDRPDLITFTPAPDASKMWGYNVYLDGQLIGTSRGTNQVSIFDMVYYLACIDPHGEVDIRLQAIDSSHNVSQQFSAPLRVVFP